MSQPAANRAMKDRAGLTDVEISRVKYSGIFRRQSRTTGHIILSFNQTTVDAVNSRVQQILNAMAVEPYPVNFSESGQLLGNVNIGPNYANCN